MPEDAESSAAIAYALSLPDEPQQGSDSQHSASEVASAAEVSDGDDSDLAELMALPSPPSSLPGMDRQSEASASGLVSSWLKLLPPHPLTHVQS